MEKAKLFENNPGNESSKNASQVVENDVSSLSEIFDNGLALFTKILETQEATNSFKVQSDVKHAMKMMEDATRLVSIANIFSSNESLEEVATENLKYFLLPVILGTLATKLCNVDNRLHLANIAQVYFTDFLKRVKLYGITNCHIPAEDDESSEILSNCSSSAPSNVEKIKKMVDSRENKLARYREKKELESRFNVLKESKDDPNIDEETRREYFITWIKCYVNTAIDEIEALKAEKQILEYMKDMLPSENSAPKSKTQVTKLKPVIITRDSIQKQVFGAGYPSLPVLTVQEFYEQRIKDGDWPDPSQRNQVGGRSLQGMAGGTSENTEDRQVLETENQIENDDPDYLARQRAMDEYKDTHKRGWGNRANRS